MRRRVEESGSRGVGESEKVGAFNLRLPGSPAPRLPDSPDPPGLVS